MLQKRNYSEIHLLLIYSAIALSKLLQHAIESNDPRLQNIQVKGEPIVNPNEGIRTRSKTAKGTLSDSLPLT